MPFPSSSGSLYQNEVKCSVFDMEMILHSYANETHFNKKGCSLGLILKVRIIGIRKWPISSLIKAVLLLRDVSSFIVCQVRRESLLCSVNDCL